MAVSPIILPKLKVLHAELTKHRVLYGLGAKAGSMDAKPESITRIDCSGLVRYEVINCTSPRIGFPDGSWIQREWCEEHLKEVPYSAVGNAGDDELFIAFMTAGVRGVGSVGHVWWVNRGRTMESYGGHGVGSHEWGVYSRRVHKCFAWPTIQQAQPIEPAKPKATLWLNNSLVRGASGIGTEAKAPMSEIVAALESSGHLPPSYDLQQLLKSLGFVIEKTTDNRAQDGKFHIAAYPSRSVKS